jgi:hypothetical protein
MTDSTFSTEIQDPLVPADVAFPSYLWTPLDINAVTEGELSFLSGDGFKAAIMLMMKSWQEKPAASLPDDPKRLAAYCGFGRGPAALDQWDAVKDEALSDFTLCSDGRWYSRTLAPQVIEAWKGTNNRKAQTEAARTAKAAKRQAAEPSPTPVTDSVTETVTTSATASIGDQRTGEERRPEDRASEDTGSGATSGRRRVGVEGGTGGQRRQYTPHQGPVLGAFETHDITISSFNMNRWARQFRNVTDILGAVTEISKDLYRIEEPKRLSYVSRKLQERDEATAPALEDANLPF